MPTSYIRLKPLSWTQAIRSDLDLRYGPGRKLSATCKPHEFLLNNGSNLSGHSLHLAFMEGEPTAANGTPLQRGIGQLFYNTHSDEVFVHGWYFSPSDIYSAIWDQVLNGGYTRQGACRTASRLRSSGCHRNRRTGWDRATVSRSDPGELFQKGARSPSMVLAPG
jgi:hypothetical protein